MCIETIQLKKDNLKYGIYPIPGNWYYDDIIDACDKEREYLQNVLTYFKTNKQKKV